VRQLFHPIVDRGYASCASGCEAGAGKGVDLVGMWCDGRGAPAMGVVEDVDKKRCFLKVLGVIFVEQLLVVMGYH
jgi:hypothetical protein